MKLAKKVLCGVSVLGIAVSSAFALDSRDEINAPQPGAESTISSASELAFENRTGESWYVIEPVDVTHVEVYDVDTNRDGLADSRLYLEQSDTMAMVTPLESSSAQ